MNYKLLTKFQRETETETETERDRHKQRQREDSTIIYLNVCELSRISDSLLA